VVAHVTRRATCGDLAGAAMILAVVALAGPSCKPNLDQTVSVITEPTVLAVRSDPPDAKPPAVIKYTTLYVDGSGPIAKVPVDSAFCEARKPLAELGPVNTKCLQASGSWFVPIGDGSPVSGALPADGCKLFGPDVPPPVMNQPQGRPVDPDATGGYYEPVRLLASDGTVTLDQTRLSCGLGGVASDVGVDYLHRYHANENPSVAALSQVGAGGAAGAPLMTSDQGTNAISPGEHLELRVAWAPCPATDVCMDGVCGPDETSESCPADCTTGATPIGCAGAERFVVFDIASQALVVQRESIAAAWYTTPGASVDADRTGRDSTDALTTSDNGWQAPAAAGLAHLWVVLRDSRGGVGWAEYAFDVK
jgi:hypothetical protein